ncbi:MAG TPA: tetraacyldisaccharide 4'-kinase [Holophagaceae bacterium]|nr:tetraacyldisaccharide 4'-kinase [Holophagaceae bacterium]
MSLLRWLAAPLSPLYGAVVGARNRAFDDHPERAARVGAPVVSIGNLSTGGTGKTPVTLFLAEGLARAGWSNVIISRGYGGSRKVDPMAVVPTSEARVCGDEPLLMARRLGEGRVVVARKRVVGARYALASDPAPKVLLLDDGFQHRALHRDLDLLLLDGARLWGNGRTLPLGDLREPMTSAARAQALVVTRSSRVGDRAAVEAWWKAYGSGGPIFWLDFRIQALREWGSGARVPLPRPELHPVYAWCGLGNPEAFIADLATAGLKVAGSHAFPDHAIPSLRRFALLPEEARACGGKLLICTEKDAVKLRPEHAALLTTPLWIAEQGVVGGEALLAWVVDRLQTQSPQAPAPADLAQPDPLK